MREQEELLTSWGYESIDEADEPWVADKRPIDRVFNDLYSQASRFRCDLNYMTLCIHTAREAGTVKKVYPYIVVRFDNPGIGTPTNVKHAVAV